MNDMSPYGKYQVKHFGKHHDEICARKRVWNGTGHYNAVNAVGAADIITKRTSRSSCTFPFFVLSSLGGQFRAPTPSRNAWWGQDLIISFMCGPWILLFADIYPVFKYLASSGIPIYKHVRRDYSVPTVNLFSHGRPHLGGAADVVRWSCRCLRIKKIIRPHFCIMRCRAAIPPPRLVICEWWLRPTL